MSHIYSALFQNLPHEIIEKVFSHLPFYMSENLRIQRPKIKLNVSYRLIEEFAERHVQISSKLTDTYAVGYANNLFLLFSKNADIKLYNEEEWYKYLFMN